MTKKIDTVIKVKLETHVPGKRSDREFSLSPAAFDALDEALERKSGELCDQSLRIIGDDVLDQAAVELDNLRLGVRHTRRALLDAGVTK